VILNTSFNLRGEPVVTSPANAFSTYSKSEMDSLVMGSFIVDKQPVSPSHSTVAVGDVVDENAEAPTRS
jgi:hypothetical protein